MCPLKHTPHTIKTIISNQDDGFFCLCFGWKEIDVKRRRFLWLVEEGANPGKKGEFGISVWGVKHVQHRFFLLGSRFSSAPNHIELKDTGTARLC